MSPSKLPSLQPLSPKSPASRAALAELIRLFDLVFGGGSGSATTFSDENDFLKVLSQASQAVLTLNNYLDEDFLAKNLNLRQLATRLSGQSPSFVLAIANKDYQFSFSGKTELNLKIFSAQREYEATLKNSLIRALFLSKGSQINEFMLASNTEELKTEQKSSNDLRLNWLQASQVLMKSANFYAKNGVQFKALQFYDQALLSLAKAETNKVVMIQQAKINQARGEYFYQLHNYQEAFNAYQAALIVYHQNGEAPIKIAQLYIQLIKCCICAHLYYTAIELSKKALKTLSSITTKLDSTQTYDYANLYLLIAQCYLPQEDYAEINKALNAASATASQMIEIGADAANSEWQLSFKLAEIYTGIAKAYFNSNQYVKALGYFQRVLALKKVAHQDYAVAECNKNIANCLVNDEQNQGNKQQFQLALKYYFQAYSSLQQLEKGNNPKIIIDLAITANEIAKCYERPLQEFSSAITFYQAAINYWQQLNNTSNLQVNAKIADNKMEIANCYNLSNLPRKANSYYQNAAIDLINSPKISINTQAALARCYCNIAKLYESVVDLRRMIENSHRAYAIEKKIGTFYARRNKTTIRYLEMNYATTKLKAEDI